jgi:hypothetical protein
MVLSHGSIVAKKILYLTSGREKGEEQNLPTEVLT